MSMYQLARNVQVGWKEQVLRVGLTRHQLAVPDRAQQQDFVKLCQFLQQARSQQMAKDFIAQHTELPVEETWTTLTQKRLVVPAPSQSEHFHARDWLYYQLYANPQEVQAELADKHVVVVGCGGIGAAVATMLRQMGLGRLTLFDDDRIAVSNLSRSHVYRHTDTGQHKVDVLCEQLQAVPIDGTVAAHAKAITQMTDLTQLDSVDLVAVCCDDRSAIELINQYSFSHDTPLMLAGYINEVATWGPMLVPGETSCFDCFKQAWLADEEVSSINQSSQAAAIVPLTLVTASMMTLDVVKRLGRFGHAQSLGRRVVLWSEPLMLERQPSTHRSGCAICSMPNRFSDSLWQVASN